MLKGKACMAYPAVRPEIERAGGKYVEADETFSNAHADGKLVTAAAWPGHPAWMRQFLQALGSKIEP